MADYTRAEMKPLQDQLECIENSIHNLQRQMMDHQVTLEEKSRTDGFSGIKQNRVGFGGTRPYFRESYTGKRFAMIHNHADHERTLGLGEIVAVLNGVQFTTRHNDYELLTPDSSNSSFLANVKIPYPEVPKSVLDKTTVADQIEEMREYFRAWKNSDKTIRADYNDYFKPVIAYLEGWWAVDSHKIRDFKSARHNLNGKTWEDLWQKYRFTVEAGRKETTENIGYLPMKLYNPYGCDDPENMNTCGQKVAQWNYRIMTAPINFNMDVDRLRLVNDDLITQVARLKRYDPKKFYAHSAARFQIHPDNKKWGENEEDRPVEYFNTLDKIFSSIPGLDNGGNTPDDAFNRATYRSDNPTLSLNPTRYHRKYVEQTTGAMGGKDRFRFFSDDQLFMAMNEQPQIAKICINNQCKRCKEKCICQRWSYAIPLEIIYLTPLSTWNPYNIKYHGDVNGRGTGIPDADGRNGGMSEAKAYDGADLNHYHFTPSEFYLGTTDEEVPDPADTSNKLTIGVLDSTGIVRSVAPSGNFRMIPEIPRVGRMRQRYPIAPIHVEGHALGKELRALQDVVLDWKKQKDVYRDQLHCPT